MLRSYFNISIRVLLRHKFYAAISILGLAVGMGVCLLIYQYIQFELSYDQFHTQAQRTYRLTQSTIRNGENLGEGVYTTYALGPRSQETIPEVEDFVRVRPQEEGPVITNPENRKVFLEETIWYVDDNFLQLFNFPLKYGDQESALTAKHNVVITERMAARYFDEANPLGKELNVNLGSLSGNFVVTGVLEELPTNSHLQFDFLFPMTFVLENWRFYRENDSEGWGLADFVTYVKLRKSADLGYVKEKVDQLVATHAIGDVEDSDNEWKIGFQPMVDIHLKSDYSRDLASNNGDDQNVKFFSIIAAFILIMAWVNYINLATARAMHRAKEVGVRKSVGALRGQLMRQFVLESAIINFTAAAIAIGIAYVILPVLNTIIGKELNLIILQEPVFWGWFVAVVTFGSLLSGFYPAFVLSAFKPARVLKSARITPAKEFSLRKGLIAFQFLMSALLISGTYLVFQQIVFMKNHDLGIDMEKILVVNGPRVILETLKQEGSKFLSKDQAFKSEVMAHHTISGIAGASSVPSKGYYYTEGFRRVGQPASTDRDASYVLTDTSFAHTYDLDFLAKTSLSVEARTTEKAIINEEALKAFGLGSPDEALHEIIVNNWGDSVEIVGVVKNIHWRSLRDAHTPILFLLYDEYGGYYSIKINMTNIQASIAHIESAYHSVFPDDPFHYSFLDDDFNRQYQADMQFGNLFSVFSVLAIFIACLGLFALVSYSATLRMKEMGIRKVLGAEVGHLMLLLSREYLVLLLAAIVLAIPAVIVGGSAWLDN